MNFSDVEAFNETYNSEIVPVLEGARADGFLAGWVVQEHNTGGDYNWKLGLLIDEWDDIDELQAAMFGSIPLTHPFWGMFTAHKDELWENLPES